MTYDLQSAFRICTKEDSVKSGTNIWIEIFKNAEVKMKFKSKVWTKMQAYK